MQTGNLDLTPLQRENQAMFKAFVDEHIAPYAGQFDLEERIPPELVEKMVQRGYWGAEVPQEYNGAGMDMVTYGLFSEEIGRGCANVRNLIGVQGMVSTALLKWGSEDQKRRWLPEMTSGKVIAAFALTEPDIGSDAGNITTTAVRSGSDYVLTGQKKWISFGQNAGLFLIFARCEDRATAFLVERNRPGFSTKPISGLLGFRASMLAELYLNECRIPQENVVGQVGSGLSHVAAYGLTHGRYSTAWGCVGLIQGCLEACLGYANRRKQFGVLLKKHQLIQGMIADMVTNLAAARLLCYRAGCLQDTGDLSGIIAISIAKYFASTMAVRIASDAVQIHGANGCGAEYPVQRYLRDAKIMEIVEGSTQIQQTLIAKHAFMGYAG